jgi:hypothetical protein
MEMTRELWKASPAMGVTCGPGQRPPRGPTSVILQDRHGGWEEKWMISMLCEEGNVDHVTMALDKYVIMNALYPHLYLILPGVHIPQIAWYKKTTPLRQSGSLPFSHGLCNALLVHRAGRANRLGKTRG